jgi:IgA Peptidase M64.
MLTITKNKLRCDMKKIAVVVFLFCIALNAQIKFDDYFENKSLRIDYFHTGNVTDDSYSIDELKEEPYWGGSKVNLLDKFDYGKYKVEVYSADKKTIIFSKTYTTLFNEWQTTAEAKTTPKTFSETVVIPYPKHDIEIDFYSRNRKNEWVKKYVYKISPANYFISKERHLEYKSFEVVNSGASDKKIDIVILPEGYTAAEMDLFKEDCKKFAGYLFNSSPFKENKDKFNIWGVEAPSIESGTDIPKSNLWKKTLLNSSFYTFDVERYLMTADNKSVRDLAANAPYDQIYIIVNSQKYGGGSIYNHYSVGTNKNPFAEYVFVHEFGHGFAGLADEYYTSEVAYQDPYPLDVEPIEPNITTLVHFEKKWKDLVDKDVPIPTPAEEKYFDKVGAFEGGGYIAKGVYRPKYDCQMKSKSVNNFCPVCKRAILEMIRFYSE